MRPVPKFNAPQPNDPIERKVDWLLMMIDRLCDASQEDTGAIADPFTVTNTTVNRTFNAQTATLAQTAQVLATLLADLKKRGLNRAAG